MISRQASLAERYSNEWKPMQMQPICHAALQQAVGLLREGKCVAFPTETVYGLGADATSDKAVAEIYATKGRPSFNPLIIHVAEVAMARRLVHWPEAAARLAEHFWPGPLTLVLPRRVDAGISLLASAGLETLAVRMPRHEGARQLLTMAGFPLAAPSANRSGRISPTCAEHVAAELGDAVPLILDGGPCEEGLESSVLNLSGGEPTLLRPGSVTIAELESVLQCPVQSQPGVIDEAAPSAPGMLASHYAPRCPVRLHASEVAKEEALLAFGPNSPAGAARVLNLSEQGDLKEAAANLFAMLRALDTPEHQAIAVMAIPRQGLGIAINDRLQRAAVTPAVK